MRLLLSVVVAFVVLPVFANEEDRAIGSLMGLAAGDAMGVTKELLPRLIDGEEEMHKAVLKQRKLFQLSGKQTSMKGFGPFMPNIKLNPGEFSDDTSMALCLADSLIAKKDLDPRDLMGRFLDWARNGYNSSRDIAFGVGGNVHDALARFGKNPANPIQGGTDPKSSGNGSIMRLAPIAIYWWNDLERAIAMARLQSSVTHNTPETLDASAFLAEIIVRAIKGEGKETIFVSNQKFGSPVIQALAVKNPSWMKKTQEEIRTLPGRASLSLEAALWCISHTNTFRDAIELVISLGGDADTIGAITGQIAGALYGENAIPRDWIQTLAFHDKIRLKANALFHRLPDSPRFMLKDSKAPLRRE